MKMKKSLVALCLSAGLLASVPAVSFADVNFVPQNTAAAPSIPASALQDIDGKVSVPPMVGALLKNEQDMSLFEKLVFMNQRNS